MAGRGAHRRTVARKARLRRIDVAVAGLAVVVGGSVAFAVTRSPKPAAHPATTTTSSTSTSTTAAPSARCPLTDLPAPHGVPNRPALAVKIGNEPEGARPQSGLNEADVVYDTPAEGFVMRYIAVFQCENASMIGPTRSLRWVDWHIMAEYGHPILAFAGGINPDVDTVMALGWLHPANLLEGAQAAAVRTSNRLPPDNLYTSTSALYSMFRTATGAPRPVFTFSSARPRDATPAKSIEIDFSYGTDVLWKWDATSRSWLHTYAGTPDVDALTGRPVTAANVVVEVVHYTYGPYVESPGSTGDVESETVGSGTGYVLRDGVAVKVTWHRPAPSDPTTYTDSAGHLVALTPGRTWVEIVPFGTKIALTP